MKNTKKFMSSALASFMMAGLAIGASNAFAAKPGFEKCAGIVKAGKNDCGNSRHSCSGNASKDGAADEWLYVPEGTCEKIVGAKIFVKEKKK